MSGPFLFLRRLAGLSALVLVGTVHAQPPPGYYDPAEGLTGPALRQALHDIIDGHQVVSYTALWSHFDETDAKPNGKVWDMYSDIPSGTPPYEFTFGSDQCGEYDEEGDCYNREHSLPNSWFGDVPPMNSDLFHIYPTDGYVNNRRGNLPFGEVNSATWTSDNGSKVGGNVAPGYSGPVFEPIDAYKGDFARSYFYMYTRYWGQTSGWSTPMQTGSDLAVWARNMLLDWNAADPVSPKEQDRNNAVFAIQDNRNPYIDDPQWAHAIWGDDVGVAEEVLTDLRMWSDQDGLHLRHGRPLDGTLLVLDLSGRTVLDLRLTEAQADVPLHLASGLYVARVLVPEGQKAQLFRQ
ncbi:MAG TPA: endonuclease [Flavobacteriales bacterium]